MSSPDLRPFRPTTVSTGLGRGVLYLLIQGVRIPLLAALRVAEPLVRVVFGALGLLSFLTALLFALTSRLPIRSLAVLLVFGLSCGLVLVLYDKAMSVLSR
jgi:hypothetical protein